MASIATLDDDVRAALFQYVCDADAPVTREAAAHAVGISRKLAAFHLDKLLASGLLDARPAATRSGRVGRTPKVYASASATISVTVPPRTPDLLAEILLAAVATEQPGHTRTSAEAIAHTRGCAVGRAEYDHLRPGRLGPERALTLCASVLRRLGYEPRRTPAAVRLHNCPFHPHARAEPELVCGINHALISGVLNGLHADTTLTATLAPRTDACCIEIHPLADHGVSGAPVPPVEPAS